MSPQIIEALRSAQERIDQHRQAKLASLPWLKEQLAAERDVREREWLQVQIDDLERELGERAGS